MIEDLIARKRVYKTKKDKHNFSKRYLISDDTKTFKDINNIHHRNNMDKAMFIFDGLTDYVEENKEDDCFGTYKNIKKVDAIELIGGMLHICSNHRNENDALFERDGWWICGIELTKTIMFEFTTTEDIIIRFDFQGLIDNEECGQTVYFQDIEDNDTYYKTLSQAHTDELVEQIKNEQDVIIELSASPLYDNPKNYFNKDSELVPNGEFAYMLEFFSDLIGYDEETYQGTFGLNSKYIKDAMRLITKVENRANEIAEKYADKGVKVTVNGMNDGCEYGMAVYVWIPYQ